MEVIPKASAATLNACFWFHRQSVRRLLPTRAQEKLADEREWDEVSAAYAARWEALVRAERRRRNGR